jgi:hypothetical protein
MSGLGPMEVALGRRPDCDVGDVGRIIEHVHSAHPNAAPFRTDHHGGRRVVTDASPGTCFNHTVPERLGVGCGALQTGGPQ